MPSPSVVVVGGGIAGLTTALRVRQALEARGTPGSVTVLEASDRLGGNICTKPIDGFTVECGPNGFLDNVPETLALVRELGLDGELVRADPRAAARYIWRRGRLHRLPGGPLSLLGSGLLGVWGRARIVLEPLQPKGDVEGDESVRSFAVRRIGAEAADVLVDAMVSGVFAGDARRLSLPAAFPKMREMEAEHGSLVRAMLARRRQGRTRGGPAGPGGTLTSFRGGMATLPHALGARLGRSVRLNTPVRGLRRDAVTGRWIVVTRQREEVVADHVVLAVPGPVAAPIAETVSTELAGVLRDIPGAGVAVVALGYREQDLAAMPEGFGFLVPRREGIRMLGCLRDSTIFPGRAPESRALVRVMIGGARDPEAVELPPEELTSVVLRELEEMLGIVAEPLMSRVFVHPLGISQYTLGHLARVAKVRSLLEGLPGLSVTGSSYRGVSMNACVEDARRVVEEVVSGFARSTPSGGSAPVLLRSTA